MADEVYAGEVQLQWLKQELNVSTAVFKIIVHGGTIRRAGRESWFERSKRERRDLLDFIAHQNIVRYVVLWRFVMVARHLTFSPFFMQPVRHFQTGVLFHGGDIHKNLVNMHPKCPIPSNRTLDYEVYELVSSGISNRGGCFTIVDIDTSDASLPTLTYTMIEGGIPQEKGRLTILKNHAEGAGVMRHDLLLRTDLMALELPDCQLNATNPTHGYPVLGGLEE